ncbi:hypothetical protein CAEBREN_12536 [Caenorhabditis brenneri]|uniref:Uncharacterized protein n=1 Tax=Caenorhabditis brenneri TaxID=135651 RepID=G0PG21_CAEBE|nr:hypothetical protein CAEBREN_12536 [Caenorhabditis brenneri]
MIFCRNLKTDKVYKYVMSDEHAPYRRVQCLCCEFNLETRVDQVWSASIKATMTPGRRVDEENGNCLWFQPVYSKWCENTQKITVFAGIYPQLDILYPWNFDLHRQNFVKSECRENCCKERFLSALAPRTFDFGNQGQCFARSHRDQAGRPLICLAITWYNKEHGQMEIFMDQDGDIGRYEWNSRLKCFFLQKTLEVRCLNHPYNKQGDKKGLWYDDDLRYMFHTKCPALKEDVYFCWHLSDGKTRKYIFDPVTLQFVLVKCPCCSPTGGYSANNTMVPTLGVYMCPATQGKVMILKDKDSMLLKVMVTVYGTSVTMPTSPIRMDSHLAPNEIISRRLAENIHITQMTQLFTAEGLEGWVLRTQRTSSDGCTQIGTMALMDGSVKPITLDCNRYNFAIYHADCVNLTKTKPQGHMKWKRYALDWDLLPEKSLQCIHSIVPIMFCYNTFSGMRGYYILDMRSGHIMEHPGCQECLRDPTKIAPIAPSTVIFWTSSPLSATDVYVATNSDGYLVKVSKNPVTEEFSGMIPLRIVTPDEVNQFTGYQQQDQLNQWKLSAMENTLRQNLEVIQSLEVKLSEMTLEAERERIRADVAENHIVNRDNNPLMDMDLSPMYRNYCPHTGHFYITSLNNRNQSIGHFVFNPTTGHFHQQDYCEACGDYTQGIKVQNFVTLMPAESPLTKFPFLVMTDDNGRLVKIGFCNEARGFVSQPASVIQPAVQDIRMIPNSMRSIPTCIEAPVDQGGPYDCYLVPQYRVYCLHCKEFLLYGFHKELQANGYFMYNSQTGHLEEHPGCDSCEAINPRYDIDTMRSVMPVVSPYSKWPLMLTTNIYGELFPIAFKTENHRFNSMPRLKIVMMNERSPRVYPQELKYMMPVTQESAKVPPVIDEPVLDVNPPAPVPNVVPEVVPEETIPKLVKEFEKFEGSLVYNILPAADVPKLVKEFELLPANSYVGSKSPVPVRDLILQAQPVENKPEEQLEDTEDEDYSDEEDEEYSDEEDEEYSDEEEEDEEPKAEQTKAADVEPIVGPVDSLAKPEESDNSDEDYSDEDEEEEEYTDEEEEEEEEEVEEAKPHSTFTFQMLQQTTQHLASTARAFTNFISAGLPSTSTEALEDDEEDCSDEEEWCCSDEECSCSDEECSDEECSDEEESDGECSDEDCSDEECECHWTDDDGEDAGEDSGKSAEEKAAEEMAAEAKAAEERRKKAEEELRKVERVCNFEPTATTSTELNLHPDFSINQRKFEQARAELRRQEELEKSAQEQVFYLPAEVLEDPNYARVVEGDWRVPYYKDVSDEEVSDEEEMSDEEEVDDEDEEEEATQPSTSSVDFEKMAKERGQTLEEFSDHLVSRFYSEVVASNDVSQPPPLRKLPEAPSDESEDSDLSRVESIGIRDISDTESEETDDSSDISRIESIGIQDISDTETALEPELDISELKIDEESDDSSDISHVESIGIQDISDTETALEPELDVTQDSVSTEPEQELDLTDLVAPLNETSSDSESELSICESTATALEPESEEIDEDNLSILSTTSTAKEFSIAHDSGSSAGSDISYLDDLSGMDGDEESFAEQEPSGAHPDDVPAQVDPINQQCVIA